MSLSKETYQLIVKYIGQKSDLCSLARVSKPFQSAAERALYNTIDMHDVQMTITLCELLSARDRLAVLVDALTVYAYEDEEELDEQYWEALSKALHRTNNLRFFNIHINGDAAQSWILRGCTFRLRSFHSDLTWDDDLLSFLQNQPLLFDLFLADYNAESTAQSLSLQNNTPTSGQSTLSSLSVLECGFIDAISNIAPGRPLVRVKTCFSRESPSDKMQELSRLLSGLRLSTAPVRALDLADSAYTEDFSLKLLSEIARLLPGLNYLGTLVLPVGRERLNFFGLLMRLRQLRAIELEITDWAPAPQPAGLRALASELRLYCPSVFYMVFVQDFERTVVRVRNGVCTVDPTYNADNLWRDV